MGFGLVAGWLGRRAWSDLKQWLSWKIQQVAGSQSQGIRAAAVIPPQIEDQGIGVSQRDHCSSQSRGCLGWAPKGPEVQVSNIARQEFHPVHAEVVPGACHIPGDLRQRRAWSGVLPCHHRQMLILAGRQQVGCEQFRKSWSAKCLPVSPLSQAFTEGGCDP